MTRARLVPCCARALRMDDVCVDRLAHQVVALEKVYRRVRDFDVLHFHVDYLHFPQTRRLRVPNVTTLHGRLDIPDLCAVYREFPDMPVVSISEDQRAPLRWLNWAGTVYHGLPEELYRLHPGPGGYLVFLGRFSPEKRADRAIAIARQAGLPIKIAAKVDSADRDYYDTVIAPLLEQPGVEYLGEVGDDEKDELLGGAIALLFPIDWPEPFGLAMIEAMACGTPVVAWRRGSVPEVVDEGVTGFVVDEISAAVQAVHRAARLDRRAVRERFEQRFSARRMAEDYVQVYRNLAAAEIEALAVS